MDCSSLRTEMSCSWKIFHCQRPGRVSVYGRRHRTAGTFCNSSCWACCCNKLITAKSWHSGARLQQLDAAAALATAHCSSTLQSTQHSVMALGAHGACGIPRDNSDQRVLLLKCSSCPSQAPGLHSVVGLIAGSFGNSWKAPTGNWINMEMFLLSLWYSSKQSLLYLCSCPACNCKGPSAASLSIPDVSRNEAEWSINRKSCKQAAWTEHTNSISDAIDSLIFSPPNILKPIHKTGFTTAFIFQISHIQWKQTQASLGRWVQTWKPWYFYPYVTSTKACFSLQSTLKKPLF